MKKIKVVCPHCQAVGDWPVMPHLFLNIFGAECLWCGQPILILMPGGEDEIAVFLPLDAEIMNLPPIERAIKIMAVALENFTPGLEQPFEGDDGPEGEPELSPDERVAEGLFEEGDPVALGLSGVRIIMVATGKLPFLDA